MLLTVLQVILVLVLGYLLTWKLLPRLYVKVARGLGFRAQMTPITQKRVARFKRIKRGYWSFVGITTLFVTSLFLEVLVNEKALVIHYDGRTAFPAVKEWVSKVLFFVKISTFEKKSDFGQIGESGVDYRAFERHSEDPSTLRAEIDAQWEALRQERADFDAQGPPGPDARDFERRRYERLQKRFEKSEGELNQLEENYKVFADGRAWAWMPLYPFSARVRTDIEANPPNRPSVALGIPLGTDTAGRDVLVLLVYGFRISLAFALIVALLGYAFGVVVGGIQGYYGGWIDIASQRVVEIWGSIPFLFTIMIIASLIQPSLLMLIVLMVLLRSWLGITYYVRGEFYREKSKDYVQAAIGAGVSDRKIILKHILPNSLVPVVTFAPFGIVAYISSLVSLDYLGFGLPPGTPSWGALLRQGLENVKYYPHLAIIPTAALAATLYAVVMIGEAVREAFDPKVFSRLR
ncbi:MAG: ABC transporter permease subunit [Planctomycetota bacterium]|jgi:microcin C transport system permease protein